MESIVLGGGCFWCIEAGFNLIKGVEAAISGYAGGNEEDADYYKVGSGTTGHAEVVKVIYDPTVITLSEILDIFWALHDPTTPDQQGNDVGPQYRSVIFYVSEAQREIAADSIAQVRKLWDDPVVTELSQLETFFPAEDNHQNYFVKNPEQGYCQVIINPKLLKLKQKFAQRLKG